MSSENDDNPKGDKPPRRGKPAPQTREDRLKAALKANMARRKAQTRARSTQNNNNNED